METAVRMMDVISETLLEDTVAGDPLHVMNYGDLVWVVAKMTGDDIASSSLNFPDLGAIKYPAEVFVDEVPPCAKLKVSVPLMLSDNGGKRSLILICCTGLSWTSIF